MSRPRRLWRLAKASIDASCDVSALDAPRCQKPRRTRRNERGAIGGIEGLAFGVLVFVFGTLIVVYAWAVIDAKLAVSAAAREAGRAYVEARPGDASVAADTAARATLAGHGRPYVSPPTVSPADFRRCGRIEVVVVTKVRRVGLPLVGRSAGESTVSARHVEYVDPYRSGLDGAAACSNQPT